MKEGKKKGPYDEVTENHEEMLRREVAIKKRLAEFDKLRKEDMQR